MTDRWDWHWYIYRHERLMLMVKEVGKYTSPMDPSCVSLRLPKTLSGGHLDTKNTPETPSQEVFGSLASWWFQPL